MKDQQGSNRISSGVIAAVCAAVVAVSGGVAWVTWNSSNSPGVSNSSAIKPKLPVGGDLTTPQPGKEQKANVYWLKPTDKSFDLVPHPVKITAVQPNQVLEKAFQNLLAGPTEGTDSTTIPKGTQLLGLNVHDNEVHVNLSEEFTSGGGSSSMLGRIGQVVYTATSLNPNAKVYIDVKGKQLDVLGGEGVELEQPLTRENFQKNYPL